MDFKFWMLWAFSVIVTKLFMKVAKMGSYITGSGNLGKSDDYLDMIKRFHDIENNLEDIGVKPKKRRSKLYQWLTGHRYAA